MAVKNIMIVGVGGQGTLLIDIRIAGLPSREDMT